MHRLLLLLPLLLAGCSQKPTPVATTDDGKTAGPTADPWPTAATTLRRQPDVAGARQVISQLTADLANNPKAEPLPVPSADAVKTLADTLRLTPNEVKEVSSPAFTALDASYIAECLVFRDAVRSLELGSHTPERKAAFGFDWACRQVYLRQAATPTPNGLIVTQPLPPQYVLLRGYGTGLERAYAFLAVLHQIGLPGCLVGPPDRDQAPSQAVVNGQPTKGPFWAVGARLPDGQIALFDPWRGRPFPGPNGGVGTLAHVLANPDAMKPWREDKNMPWDVSADDVKAATVYAAFNFSAIAPRMKVMEQKVAADVGVTLARDVADTLKQFGPAAKVWAPDARRDPFCFTRVQESFLPVEEGGIDHAPKDARLFDLVRIQQVPLDLFAMPAGLTSPDIRARLASGYFARLQEWVYAANPREKVVRGQFNELIRGLVSRERKLDEARDRVRSKALSPDSFAAWVQETNRLLAEVSKARLPQNQANLPAAEQELEQFWAKGGPAFQHLEDTIVAPVAAAEVAYFLAVCKHEQAERAAVRMHRTPPGDPARAAADRSAQEAWAVAKDTWDRYFAVAEPFLQATPERAVQTAHLRRLADRAGRLAANPTAEW